MLDATDGAAMIGAKISAGQARASRYLAWEVAATCDPEERALAQSAHGHRAQEVSKGTGTGARCPKASARYTVSQSGRSKSTNNARSRSQK